MSLAPSLPSSKIRHMKITALRIGMQVRHAQYGLGIVKGIAEHTADIQFDDSKRIVEPEASGITPAEATASVEALSTPLHTLIDEIVSRTVEELGIEKPSSVVQQLGLKWNNGKMVLHPSDPTLQTKEVPLEVFFHKIVMVRNNLRTMEMKINAHPTLTDGEKVELQQYITRSYGSLTTFNLLFREKEEQFGA